MNAKLIAYNIARGKSVDIHGTQYSFVDFASSADINSDALLAALYGTIKPLEDSINEQLEKWVDNLIENKGGDMSGKNIAELSQKEKADKIRMSILALTDDELVFAECHTFGSKFEPLSEWIKRTSEEVRSELPF